MSVIFDSGTSLAYIPVSIAATVISELLSGVSNQYYSGIYYVDCSTVGTMPSLFLTIENYWFEIPSSTYIVHLADAYGPYCVLGFLSNSVDTWLLGDVFFRNYYAIFDDKNS